MCNKTLVKILLSVIFVVVGYVGIYLLFVGFMRDSPEILIGAFCCLITSSILSILLIFMTFGENYEDEYSHFIPTNSFQHRNQMV